MERIRSRTAISSRISQRFNNLQHLDEGAGPSVRENDGQGILMLGTNVNEVNIQPIDLSQEVRQGIQLRFELAPVVIRGPIRASA